MPYRRSWAVRVVRAFWSVIWEAATAAWSWPRLPLVWLVWVLRETRAVSSAFWALCTAVLRSLLLRLTTVSPAWTVPPTGTGRPDTVPDVRADTTVCWVVATVPVAVRVVLSTPSLASAACTAMMAPELPAPMVAGFPLAVPPAPAAP